MKLIINIFILSFFSTMVFGQTNDIKSKLSVTENIIDSNREFDNYSNSNLTKDSNEQTVIRFIYKGQVIKIFSSNDGKFHANIINYVRQYKTYDERNTVMIDRRDYRYLYQQINIDDSVVEKVIRGIFDTNLLGVTSDSSVEMQSMDGHFPMDELIFLEFRSKEGKHCKQILNRSIMSVSSNKLNKLVKLNFDQIMSMFELHSNYSKFLNELPNEQTYSINGIGSFQKNANGDISQIGYIFTRTN